MQSLMKAPERERFLAATRLSRVRAKGRMKGGLFLLVMAALFISVGATTKAMAAPGDLDSNFGNGGTVVMDMTGYDDNANGVVSQPDGKVIVVGYGGSNGGGSSTFIMRFNTNGQLDPTFGTAGKIFPSPLVYASCALVQPDGKILVAGSAGGSFSVARFNSNGTLDQSFGNGGVAPAVFFNGRNGLAYGIVLQPDGKIVLAGNVNIAYRDSDFGVVRYTSDGRPDMSFGNAGAVNTSFGGGRDNVHAVALQPDGKIVVGGDTAISGEDVDYAIARYNTDGTLDASFDGDGKVTTNFFWQNFARVYGMAIQPDGKIIAAGSAGVIGDLRLGVARYNPNGSLDASFGQDGKQTVTFPGYGRADGYGVAIQPDGKIVVGGAANSGSYNFALTRFQANGNLDPSFGAGGRVTTDLGGDDVAYAMSFQPNGRIILAGHTGAYPNMAFALAVYSSDAGRRRTTTDFDGDGRTDIGVWRPGEGNWYLINSSDNAPRAQIEWGRGGLGDRLVPRDYDGDGKTDIAVWRSSEGNWYIINSATGSVQVRGWGSDGDAPVPADYDGDGRADLAVFRPSDGNWYILQSSTARAILRNWGNSTDQPVPGDYDGDGRTDIAVWRSSEGNWYIIQSGSNSTLLCNLGFYGDMPVPTATVQQ